jgi:hypothetical protein
MFAFMRTMGTLTTSTHDLNYFFVLLPDLITHRTFHANMLVVLLKLFLRLRANMAIHARVAFLGNLTDSARVSIAFALHRNLFA